MSTQRNQQQQHTDHRAIFDETANFVLREALTSPDVQLEQAREEYGSGIKRIIQGVLIGIADLVGAIAFTFLLAGVWHQALSALAAWFQVLLWLAALGLVIFVGSRSLAAMAEGYIAMTHGQEIIEDRRARRQRQNQLTEVSVTVMQSAADVNYAEAARIRAEAQQKTYTFPMSDDQGNALVRNPLTGQFELLLGNMRAHPGLTSYHHSETMAPGVKSVKEEAAPALPAPRVPTGRELLLNGTIERTLAEGCIILGMTTDGELAKLKIKRCFSTLVSGLPSVGKSTTVFWIAGQLVIIGARIWIVDPHMYFQDEEGNKSLAAELAELADSFVFPPSDGETQAVLSRVRFMYTELRKRQKPGYIVKAKDTIIGIMDEFNSIADSIDPDLVVVTHEGRDLNFAQTLALIEREGRKYGLHFMLIGHKWARQDIGGDNAVRTNATTYLCHKLNDQRQADLLLGSGQGKKVLQLTVGSYWITGPTWNAEPAKITTPAISALDLPVLLEIKRRGVRVLQEGNVVDADPVQEIGMGSAPAGIGEMEREDPSSQTVPEASHNGQNRASESISQRTTGPLASPIPPLNEYSTPTNAPTKPVKGDAQDARTSMQDPNLVAFQEGRLRTQNVQENGQNGLVEPSERVQNEFVAQPGDKLLNDLQRRLLIAYYRDCRDVKLALRRIKNDRGEGLGVGTYYRHACWILDGLGLRKKRS